MAIEIVDCPIKNGDFPISFLYVYQRVIMIPQHPEDAGIHWQRSCWLRVAAPNSWRRFAGGLLQRRHWVIASEMFHWGIFILTLTLICVYINTHIYTHIYIYTYNMWWCWWCLISPWGTAAWIQAAVAAGVKVGELSSAVMFFGGEKPMCVFCNDVIPISSWRNSWFYGVYPPFIMEKRLFFMVWSPCHHRKQLMFPTGIPRGFSPIHSQWPGCWGDWCAQWQGT